jgi:hypothetical protein
MPELHRDTDLRLTEPLLPDPIEADLQRLAAHDEKFKPQANPYARMYFWYDEDGYRYPMSWSEMQVKAQHQPWMLHRYYDADGKQANRREILAPIAPSQPRGQQYHISFIWRIFIAYVSLLLSLIIYFT